MAYQKIRHTRAFPFVKRTPLPGSADSVFGLDFCQFFKRFIPIENPVIRTDDKSRNGGSANHALQSLFAFLELTFRAPSV